MDKIMLLYPYYKKKKKIKRHKEIILFLQNKKYIPTLLVKTCLRKSMTFFFF